METAWQRRLTAWRAQRGLPRWLGIGCVVVGFAVAALFIAPGDIAPESPATFAEEPDAYLEDAAITQYDDDGGLRYRLRSPRIAYLRGEEHTRLTAPVFELHSPDAPTWRARAEVGDVYRVANDAGGLEEEVRLRGAVDLAQNHVERGLLAMRTEGLTIYPARRYARTSEPAIIAAGAVRASAAGFETDLRSGRTKLLSSATQRVSIIVPADQFN